MKRRRARPILDLVARCPELAFLGLAGLFVCLPGPAQAHDAFSDSSSHIYTLHVGNSVRPSKFQVSVTYSSSNAALGPDAPGGALLIAPASSVGGWEVTVGFDAAHCEIHCAYRRKRDAFGRMSLAGLLLPPITAIQIYEDSASKPLTVIVDPAGLRLPIATGHVVVTESQPGIPGRRLCASVPGRQSGCAATSPRAHFSSTDNHPETSFSAAAPLRI